MTEAGSHAAMSGANWSDELESIHEESSRTHFLDVWTRDAILDGIDPLPSAPFIIDVGCSTGYLLEDLRHRHAAAHLVGVDFVFAGLLNARSIASGVSVVQGDACNLPFPDEIADAIVSANLLEHIADDRSALAEMRRVLKPGGAAAIVVPAGPQLYDYYDRFLFHERRYRRGELAAKARSVGLAESRAHHLGSLIFPAFWAMKKRNQFLRGDLTGDALRAQVERDIAATNDSALGKMSTDIERRLVRSGRYLHFGIRELLVVRRPE